MVRGLMHISFRALMTILQAVDPSEDGACTVLRESGASHLVTQWRPGPVINLSPYLPVFPKTTELYHSIASDRETPAIH